MHLRWALAALACTSASVTAKPARREYNTHNYYVLEHAPRSGTSINDIARALGVEVIEQAGELPNHWLVRAPASLPASSHIAKRNDDPVLAAYDSLRSRSRSSSLFHRSDAHEALRLSRGVTYLERQVPRQRVKRASPPIHPSNPDDKVVHQKSHDVALTLEIRDPEFSKQWHLVNDEYPRNSMNATGVWEMGITGKGIISALVDDGLDYTSDDLASNFDAYGSYDFNDHVDLPTPVLQEDHHGTRCAGQIAAAKNNVCGIGMAYDSKVAGIRILSGPISDIDEAASLNYGFQNTSIFSCSWGPTDDGKSMEAPGYLVEKAVVNGINNGRGGKGSVFVFASGNGANWGDQCNFDGYTNSIYSITVAAVDYKGLHPPYSEACAANMVVAFTSGSGNHITTTDVGKNACSSVHGGTSAAAPNAVGVFALALSVRPDLTWRDMQHLSVRTAVQINPNDPDWDQTAQGRPFSYKYGFGVLDAYAYVTAAKDWKSVKPQSWLVLPYVQIANGTMNILDEMSGGEPLSREGVKSVTKVTKEMLDAGNVETLEHVTVKVWIEHQKRGDVEVELISPSGVKSVLAAKRSHDAAKTGFPGWRFMSVKHWDENPVGDWTIRVSDQGNEHKGAFLGWEMSLWGSSIDPSKTTHLEVAKLAAVFPPLHPDDADSHPAASSSIAQAATSTKAFAHPTSALPDDHGLAEGEAHKPAFGSDAVTSTSTSSAKPSASASDPTADEGWFSDMKSLSSSRRWLGGALAIALLFLAGAGIFFWRRRRQAQARRAQYAAVAGDSSAMPLRARGTKELYDAFGELSDEDEDADEETGLRRPLAGGMAGRAPLGAEHEVGYHSGFLDDEDGRSEGGYKDEPIGERGLEPQHGRREGSSSSVGSGSGDGSWAHASQMR